MKRKRRGQKFNCAEQRARPAASGGTRKRRPDLAPAVLQWPSFAATGKPIRRLPIRKERSGIGVFVSPGLLQNKARPLTPTLCRCEFRLAIWIYLFSRARQTFWQLREDDIYLHLLANWPRVTAIVPARNEAEKHRKNRPFSRWARVSPAEFSIIIVDDHSEGRDRRPLAAKARQ